MRHFWLRLATLLILTGACLSAQRRGGGGGSSSSAVSAGPDELIARGTVVLAEGGVPPRLVRLDRSCGGRIIGSTFADSKGRFSFDLGVLDSEFRRAGANTANFGSVSVVSPELLKGCSIRASLLGYRSPAISLEQVAKKGNANLGDMTLEPVGKPLAPLMSATDSDVPKNAKRDFDKGFDEASRSKWPEAIASIEKAASAYPKYAHAWLSLGMLQTSHGGGAAARRSFEQAIAADDKFAPPYVELAALDAAAGDWQKTVEHSSRAIALDPDSFPLAYYLNAVANVRMVNADAADKSAEAGLRIDQEHEYPDLAYIQGLLLSSKGDQQGARKQYENYLAEAPAGINAAAAKQQLAELPAPK
jgi:tetratricopeptide (TPR) repeat protein